MIHDFYGRECSNPVHMLVDTGLTQGRMNVKAFVSSSLSPSVTDRPWGSQFQQIKLDFKTFESEKVGCTRDRLHCLTLSWPFFYHPIRRGQVHLLNRMMDECNQLRQIPLLSFHFLLSHSHSPATLYLCSPSHCCPIFVCCCCVQWMRCCSARVSTEQTPVPS